VGVRDRGDMIYRKVVEWLCMEDGKSCGSECVNEINSAGTFGMMKVDLYQPGEIGKKRKRLWISGKTSKWIRNSGFEVPVDYCGN
jgi:hypothetical protein